MVFKIAVFCSFFISSCFCFAFSDWSQVDRIIDDAIASGYKFPGMVILVAGKEKIHKRTAYGQRITRPQQERTTIDTIFDMASVTKAVATASSMLLLNQRKMLSINDYVKKYIPCFVGNGKDKIKISHLLSHSSGIIAHVNYKEKFLNRMGVEKEIINDICNRRLKGIPGKQYIYSDLNYILLGHIVLLVSGQNLNDFSREQIFKPLEMEDTGFVPLPKYHGRCAATVYSNGVMKRGIVHDGNSEIQHGISGHAGLFSTANDLLKFGRMLLNGGKLPSGVLLFTPETMKLIKSPAFKYDGGYGYARSMGWMYIEDNEVNGNSYYLPKGSIFHMGYTGTGFFIDFKNEQVLIMLANRVHIKGLGNSNDTYKKILRVLYSYGNRK